MERFQTTEVNTDGLFDYNPNLFFSGIALMAFSPIIFCLPCMCRSCFQKCKCSSCCKSGSALQSADQLGGDRKQNHFQHHYSIDSETGDVQPANNETGKNEFILKTTPLRVTVKSHLDNKKMTQDFPLYGQVSTLKPINLDLVNREFIT